MNVISTNLLVAIMKDAGVSHIEVRTYAGGRQTFTPMTNERKNIGIGLTEFKFKCLQAEGYILASGIVQADCVIYGFTGGYQG